MPPRAVIVIVALVVAMGAFFVLGAVTNSPHLPPDIERRVSHEASPSSLLSPPTPVLPGAPPPLPPLPAGNPRDERWPAPPPSTHLADDPVEPAQGIRGDCDDLDGLPRTLGDVYRPPAPEEAARVRHDGCARPTTTTTKPALAAERGDGGP